MSTQTCTPEQEAVAAAIQAEHPRWRVWVADNGTWCASWAMHWPDERTRHGHNAHIGAESPRLLRLSLAEEDSCATCGPLHTPEPLAEPSREHVIHLRVYAAHSPACKKCAAEQAAG